MLKLAQQSHLIRTGISTLSTLALLLAPTTGQAQLAQFSASGRIVDDPNNGSVGTFLNCPDFAPTCTLTSPDGTRQITSFASATIGGPLRVAGSALANSAPAAPNPVVVAFPDARYYDTFTLSNVPSGGTIQFNLHLTGSGSNTGAFGVGDPDTWATSALWVGLWYNTSFQPQNAHNFIPLPPNQLASNAVGMFNGLYSVTVPAAAGPAPFLLRMQAIAQLTGMPYVAGGSTLHGSAYTDFYNTAYLQSILFFDANGVDVSDQVGFFAASGAQYQIGRPQVETVPEPGTMMLVASGLAMMAGGARRRRASTSSTPS